jgi:AraC-like DNA-binding protein
MIENTYSVQIPSINNFRTKFYFQTGEKIINAHDFPPHLHDELEIYILIEGDVSFVVENKKYKLTSGDIIVSRPNEMHNCILNSNSVHKHLCFWFDASCEFLLDNLLKKNYPNLISPSADEKADLLEIYELVSQASESNNQRRQFYLLMEMLDVINRSAKNPITQLSLPDSLSKILADIDKHFIEINSLSYFTEKYSISQSTLNRLFKIHLNTSPKVYLETKRIAYSRILLCEGKTVFEACIQSGFPDYSNYIRLFKKMFGITPKQYQNKQRYVEY